MNSKNKSIGVRLQRSLLSSVIGFLIKSGADPKTVSAIAERSVSAARRRRSKKAVSTAYLQTSDLSADVLRMWHREDRYIDTERARPLPLSLSRGKNSLRSMALRLDKNADVPALLDFLQRSGLIYKFDRTRYLPSTDAGTISKNEGFVAEHVVKSIVRIIETVERNTKFDSGFQPLIERFAYVSDLHADEVQDFCEFTKTQGHSYLQVVDDWMERRRVRKRPKASPRRPTKENGVFAGVQVIAFLGRNDNSDVPAPTRARATATARMASVATNPPPSTPS